MASTYNVSISLTRIVFYFKRRPDGVVRVRVHPECERWSVALGSVVVVSGEDLDNLARGTLLRKYGPGELIRMNVLVIFKCVTVNLN